MTGRKTDEHLSEIDRLAAIERGKRRNTADRIITVVCHDLTERNQQESSSGKSRVHEVLSEPAEETLRDQNTERRTENRNVKRTLRRKAECQEKTCDNCGTVPQSVRPLCDEVKQILRQHRRCNTRNNHKRRMQSEMPDTEHSDRNKTDHNIHHNAAGRQRISQMR